MIELKIFERDDFKELTKWIDSSELLKQWSGSVFDYPLNETQLERYIKDANLNTSTTMIFKVINKETGRSIGHISLSRIDLKNKSARISRVLIGDRTSRGKGICQQMIEEILKIAFGTMKFHRVSLGVFDFNESAIVCYEKAGMKKEGLIRDMIKHKGDYWSLWEMSILEHEWEDIQDTRRRGV